MKTVGYAAFALRAAAANPPYDRWRVPELGISVAASRASHGGAGAILQQAASKYSRPVSWWRLPKIVS
jgi:hypothetical protein